METLRFFLKCIDFNGLHLLSPGEVAGVDPYRVGGTPASFTHLAHCSHLPPTGHDARCTWIKEDSIKAVGGADRSGTF